MPSGKQTSFQFGEVSPSLRFRSDAVSYTAGLSKLKNMYVRRAGGVSNRAGLELVQTPELQQDISPVGSDPGVKGFTIWDANTKIWKTYQYGKIYNSAFDRFEYGFLVDNTERIFAGTNSFDNQFLSPEPKDIILSPSRDGIFISPSAKILTKLSPTVSTISDRAYFIKYYVNPDIPQIPNNKIGYIEAFGLETIIGVSVIAEAYFSTVGGNQAPLIQATYLITGIDYNDVEIYLIKKHSVFTPNQYLRNDITLNFTIIPKLKKINLYRAASKVQSSLPFYKFVGQIIPTPGEKTFLFSDYGAEDLTRTPPLDISYFNTFGNLNQVNTFCYYQQRMIASFDTGNNQTIKAGDLVASKIGAPLEFSAPLIYTNTGAFQFSVPVSDGTPVVAMLAMERLIAFTEKGVYAVRGGEQGVLTPTTVNPLLISEEGCSKTVQPKVIGSKGYFINNAHTKLMFIVFGNDGNLSVGEASLFSDHTLLLDVIQLEVLSTGDDTVYLLRRDGKLVQVTVTEEGVHGFSILETDKGYIESIFRGKTKKNYIPSVASETIRNRFYDSLMCYVIRNGTRFLEKLNPREDLKREAELFLDCAVRGGAYLTFDEQVGYRRLSASGALSGVSKINIVGGFTESWDAGELITIYSTDKLSVFYEDIPEQDKVIHFYYGDNQYVRYFIDLSTEAPLFLVPGGFKFSYLGYFNADVPEELRDVVGQNISLAEKNKRLTRWLPAYKIIDTTTTSFISDFKYNSLWDAINVDNLFEGSYPIGIYADGEVISSPLNPSMPTIELKKLNSGKIEIDLVDYFSYWHVGIPYECEFETLDLETAGERTVTDAKKLINAVGLGLMETRGGFAGIPEQTLQNMTPIVTREDESFNNQTKNFNGHIVVHIPTEWNEPGRATIKHVDPTPISILSVYPKGIAGD
jgi:hypothetical protein